MNIMKLLKYYTIQKSIYRRYVLILFSRSGDYVIGTKEKIELAAIITNKGEDAFNARFFLQVYDQILLFFSKIFP